jgi:hypothetical protein
MYNPITYFRLRARAKRRNELMAMATGMAKVVPFKGAIQITEAAQSILQERGYL